MDDHFWPSVYPGIIAGLLVALAVPPRGAVTTLTGAVAGFVGAAVGVFAAERAGLTDDVPQLLVLFGAAAGAAYLAVLAVRRLGPANAE